MSFPRAVVIDLLHAKLFSFSPDIFNTATIYVSCTQHARNVNWQSPERERERVREREREWESERENLPGLTIDVYDAVQPERRKKKKVKEKVAMCGFAPLSSAILASPIRVRRKFTPVWTYASGPARSGDFLIATWRCHSRRSNGNSLLTAASCFKTVATRYQSRPSFARWRPTSNKFRRNDELSTLRAVDVEAGNRGTSRRWNYLLWEMLKKKRTSLSIPYVTMEQCKLYLELKIIYDIGSRWNSKRDGDSQSLSSFFKVNNRG